jgi:hypothetical protein
MCQRSHHCSVSVSSDDQNEKFMNGEKSIPDGGRIYPLDILMKFMIETEEFLSLRGRNNYLPVKMKLNKDLKSLSFRIQEEVVAAVESDDESSEEERSPSSSETGPLNQRENIPTLTKKRVYRSRTFGIVQFGVD